MKKIKQNKKRGVSPVATAVAGMVVGAGIAVAGAIVLSNENNQKKMKGVYNKTKNKIVDYVDNVNAKVNGQKETIKGKIDDNKNKATKTLKTVTETNNKLKNIWQK